MTESMQAGKLSIFTIVVVSIATVILSMTGPSWSQATTETNAKRQDLKNVALQLKGIANLAINGEAAPVAKNMHLVGDDVRILQGLIPAQTFRDIKDRLLIMDDAQKNGDLQGVALAAADGFRTIMLARDPKSLPVPIEVYLLEYTGLKTLALASANSPGWQRLGDIADETSDYWAEIAPNIKQAALRRLMDMIISGTKRAGRQQDVSELRFVTKLQLDAVDFLKKDGAFIG